jgi:hypothetical protein
MTGRSFKFAPNAEGGISFVGIEQRFSPDFSKAAGGLSIDAPAADATVSPGVKPVF